MDFDQQQINDFITALQLASLNTDTHTRTNTQQLLLAQFTSQPNLIQYIIAIIQTQQPIIKQIASAYLASIMQKLLQLPNYILEIQALHIDLLIQTLQNHEISLQIKNQLTQVIGTFISKSLILKKQVLMNCFEIIQKIDQIQIALFLFQSLISSFEFQQDDLHLIETFSKLGQQISIDLSPQMLINYNLYAKITYQLCKNILMCNSIPSKNLPSDTIIMNENLSSSIMNCLLATSDSKFISQTEDSAFDDDLNEAKSYILKSLNLILDYLINQRNKQEMKLSPFYHKLVEQLPTFIVSLLNFVNLDDFYIDNLHEKETFILNQLLKFCSECVKIQEFQQIFYDSLPSLVFDVIYPFISTSSKEFELLKNDPNQFVNLSIDTVDEQNSDILKTNVAKFLEALCDYVDGAITFITEQAIDIVNGDFQYDHVETRYLSKKMRMNSRVESSLMILSVISYVIAKREDVIYKLEEMMHKNIKKFQKADLIVQVRLSLFLGYYCDTLFKREERSDNLIIYFYLLMKQLSRKEQGYINLYSKKLLVQIYQSVDALKTIFEDNDVQPKLKPFIQEVFPGICKLLYESQSDQHFELIISFLKYFPEEMSMNNGYLLSLLISFLVQRIIMEQKKIAEGKSQIWMMKSLNVLESIAENCNYVPRFISSMEKVLMLLYGMLQNLRMVQYYDEILHMVSCFIETSMNVSETQMMLIQVLPEVHLQQSYRLGGLFRLLNLFLVYGKQVFYEKLNQQILIKICVDSITCCEQQQVNQSQSMLLIQLMIEVKIQKYQIYKQQLGLSLELENLVYLIQVILQMSSQHTEQNVLKSRLLGVLLCSLFFDLERAIYIFDQLNISEQIIPILIDNYDVYKVGYDIKLYILTMSKLLVSLGPQIFSVKLIDSMVTLLIKQQTYINTFTQNEQVIELQDNDDQENKVSNDDTIDNSQREEISMQQFISGIKIQDEFEYFKRSFHLFKKLQDIFNIKIFSSYPSLFEQIQQNLPIERFDHLQEILLHTRVESQNTEVAPRKVQKIYLQMLKQIFTIKQRKQH